MTEKPSIFVIGCGGTISAVPRQKEWRVWKTGELTVHEILKNIPLLSRIAKVDAMDLFREDSSNIVPENWATLAQVIFLKLKKADGIVVLHGTDTLHYTAAAISFLLQELNKPVVFTGSQFALSQIGSDGRRNVFDSLRVAAEADIAESIVVFNGKILRGNRTKKFKEIEFDAFGSVGMSALGRIENSITLSGEQEKRNNKQPVLTNRFEPNVYLLKLHPGFRPEIIETMINNGTKGFVFEGFGAGNVPTLGERAVLPYIKRCVSSNIPVVISTQCSLGTSWVYLYEVGKKALDVGGIPGFDLLSETALVKLMWVLGQTRNMEKIKEMMHQNYSGEITPEVRTVEQKSLYR